MSDASRDENSSSWAVQASVPPRARAAARARGKHSGRPAKLTEAQVRALRAGGESISEVVAGFGVSLATVYRALREDTQAQAS